MFFLLLCYKTFQLERRIFMFTRKNTKLYCLGYNDDIFLVWFNEETPYHNRTL